MSQKSLSVPVSSPSKIGVQGSEVQSFAKRLETRFRNIADNVGIAVSGVETSRVSVTSRDRRPVRGHSE